MNNRNEKSISHTYSVYTTLMNDPVVWEINHSPYRFGSVFQAVLIMTVGETYNPSRMVICYYGLNAL